MSLGEVMLKSFNLSTLKSKILLREGLLEKAPLLLFFVSAWQFPPLHWLVVDILRMFISWCGNTVFG